MGQTSTISSPDAAPSDALPVARYSPSRGIFVDRTGMSVAIAGRMELSGPEATPDRAQSIESSINKAWTWTFSDGYAITCKVSVKFRLRSTLRGEATQISAQPRRACWMTSTSHAHVTPGSERSICLSASDRTAFTWTAAHEFGHVIGLADRYSESIMSRIKDLFGGTRTTVAHPGYEYNIMGADRGTLESKNVADLVRESEPSLFGRLSDDELRDWVMVHSASELRQLSTAAKLKMIDTLMSGLVTCGDLQTLLRIMDSVTSAAEANAIRPVVNALNWASPEQRLMVRAALARMPR